MGNWDNTATFMQTIAPRFMTGLTAETYVDMAIEHLRARTGGTFSTWDYVSCDAAYSSAGLTCQILGRTALEYIFQSALDAYQGSPDLNVSKLAGSINMQREIEIVFAFQTRNQVCLQRLLAPNGSVRIRRG